MHETKALEIRDKIANGDQEILPWAELLNEFTDM